MLLLADEKAFGRAIVITEGRPKVEGWRGGNLENCILINDGGRRAGADLFFFGLCWLII